MSVGRPGTDLGASAWRGAELLERAVGYARGSLVLVDRQRLTVPTPCSAWDLRSLLAHLADSLASLVEAGADGAVPLAGPARPPDDPVSSLRPAACDLLARWSEGASPRGSAVLVGGRPLSSPVVATAGALEVAVHGWDVAAACGADRPLPEALASDLLRVAPVLVTAADRPGRFAEPLPIAPGASSSEALLAFLGRSLERHPE